VAAVPLVVEMAFRRLIIRSWVALGATFTIAAGCRDFSLAPAPPELPPGAEALTPLATYADWWQATERCAGVSGNMSRISWFVVPNHTSFVYDNVQYDGYWWNGVHWILLAGEDVTDGMLVRHEMLHELLGRGDHPAKYFQQQCAALVVCNYACRADG
jgi:hypothetical protein